MRNVVTVGILIVCVIAIPVIGIWSGVVAQRMVGAVNPHLPPEERFTTLGWRWGKYRRLSAAYRRFHPTGDGARQLRMLQIAGAVAVILLVLSLYFGAWQ